MLKNQPEAVVKAIKEIMEKSAQTAQEEKQVSADKLNKKYEQMKPLDEIANILKAVDKADRANKQVQQSKMRPDVEKKFQENPKGVEVHMKHEKTGKMSVTKFPGTFGAVAAAKKHISNMEKQGYKLHAKKLMEQEDSLVEKTHTVPKSEKEKKLAAMAHPKDKITHKDVMVGRGVIAKEEVEQADEARHSDPGKRVLRDIDAMEKRAKGPINKVASSVVKKVLAKKAQQPKGMKEEVELEEGRGRPRKNPNDPKWQQKKPMDSEDGEHENLAPDSGKEADQHIHVRLKQAADSSEKGGSHVKFDNGKEHFVKQHVAKTVLSGLDRMKPDLRKQVHDHIQKSHDNLMQVHTMLAGKK